nr:centrin 3 [Hymenolepis microstoma]
MLPKRSVANSVNSETFWRCVSQTDWPDFIDITSIILEITAIILNAITGYLLLQIKEGNPIIIFLLRTIVFNSIIDAIIKLANDLTPSKYESGGVALNYFLCVVWDSRFLFWLFSTFSVAGLALFSLDRALTLLNKDSLRLVPAESRLRTYQISIYLYGLFLTAPQFISVNLENGTCTCAPTTVNVPVLALLYAHVFIRYVLLVILNGGILCMCAGLVIKWIKQTPSKHQVDELNSLHFDIPSAAELKRLEESHSWKTPSLCILPISIFYVMNVSFDAGYQFISGIGLTTYVIGGKIQRFGILLLIFFSNTVPLTLLVMLPVFRFWLRDKLAFFNCCKRIKNSK